MYNTKYDLKNVDWFITRKCNQAKYCQFCNAPWNRFPSDAGLEKSLEICDRMIDLGVDIVTLCGGEPTQYRFIKEVVKFLNKGNIKVVFYSNTVSVPDFDWGSVLPLIYFLSLPVDALSDSGVQFMRGRHQDDGVKRVLSILKKVKNPPRVKIGTVVTRGNVKELPKILNFVIDNKIDVWRLYQFSPFGLGFNNKNRYLIDDEIFDKAVREVIEMNSSDVFISSRTRNDISSGYCHIIDSEGNFYRYNETDYVSLGVSIFDDVKRILKRYEDTCATNIQQKYWHELELI